MNKSKHQRAIEFMTKMKKKLGGSDCPELILNIMKLGARSLEDENFDDYAEELEAVARSQLEETRNEIMSGPIGERLRECPFGFTGISSSLLEIAADAWEERDALKLLLLMPSEDRLDFVWNNVRPLIIAGMYEQALFNAYVNVNMNTIHSLFTRDELLYLFRQCPRETLRKCGDSYPHKGPFTVYRGVVDGGNKESIRRISWTSSPNIAAWFALEAGRPEPRKDPAVFSLFVPEERVFFYTNDKDEQEFVLDMYPQARPKRIDPMTEPVQP